MLTILIPLFVFYYYEINYDAITIQSCAGVICISLLGRKGGYASAKWTRAGKRWSRHLD